MQREPKSVALRTPFHLAGGMGGFQRRSPTGGLANGTPRKAEIVPSDLPSSLPVSILTVGAEPAPRILTAANNAVRRMAPTADEKPSLIMESPGEARGTISQRKGARKSNATGRVFGGNVFLDAICRRGLGSIHWVELFWGVSCDSASGSTDKNWAACW